MPRFTISDLLIGILFVALVCGAVANAEHLSAPVLVLLAYACSLVLLYRLHGRK
jgi:predicted branched-subunit amino acid permease